LSVNKSLHFASILGQNAKNHLKKGLFMRTDWINGRGIAGTWPEIQPVVVP
jgi:hypothetical protein